MKPNLSPFFRSLALFVLMVLLSSSWAAAQGRTSSAEDLNPQIVERRHLHVMKEVLNNALDLQFEQIVFEYTSVAPDMTTPVRLTASISMPPAVYNKVSDPRGIILYNEFTTAKHRERTSQDELNDIGLYLNKYQNLILVAADLYGWTLTEDKPQAYCCPEVTSVETLDAWDAAMMILEQEGYKHQDLPIYNIGYSSGGFSAMSVQKYIDEQRPDLFVNGTYVGSSPFDITSVYENYVKTNFTGYQCAMPLLMVAYKETYDMPFSYSDIFLPPLGDSIQQWILSKDYGTWDINALIGLDAKVNEVLSPAACDYTQGIGRDIYLKFRDNSVCGPWATWQPNTDTEYFVFHSSGDLYMHYFVSLEMANYLSEHGCTVMTDFSDWGNHIDYGIYVYMVNVLSLIENNIGDGSSLGKVFIQFLQEHLLEFMQSDPGDVTAIESVQAVSRSDDEGCYTLSGERLSQEPKRGLYIHRGVKKVQW